MSTRVGTAQRKERRQQRGATRIELARQNVRWQQWAAARTGLTHAESYSSGFRHWHAPGQYQQGNRGAGLAPAAAKQAPRTRVNVVEMVDSLDERWRRRVATRIGLAQRSTRWQQQVANRTGPAHHDERQQYRYGLPGATTATQHLN